jgi:hypothetical protein
MIHAKMHKKNSTKEQEIAWTTWANTELEFPPLLTDSANTTDYPAASTCRLNQLTREQNQKHPSTTQDARAEELNLVGARWTPGEARFLLTGDAKTWKIRRVNFCASDRQEWWLQRRLPRDEAKANSNSTGEQGNKIETEKSKSSWSFCRWQFLQRQSKRPDSEDSRHKSETGGSKQKKINWESKRGTQKVPIWCKSIEKWTAH